MTETALAVINRPLITTFAEAERAASAMATSGFFSDSRTAAQAIVKILAGQELGFGPFASMKGVYIIQGGPSLSANLMAAAVKKSGRYNYRVLEMTDTACEIAFYEQGQEIGRSKFTADDAKRAGTKNMDKFPRNMLFARAMSNGVRWYCPDVFNGNTVYTPEELGATVNEDGDVIDVTPTPAKSNGNGHHAEPGGMVEAGQAAGGKVTVEEPEQPKPEAPKANGRTVKIGKNAYPFEWGVAISEAGIYGNGVNAFEVDGILQQHGLNHAEPASVAVKVITDHLAAKRAAKQGVTEA